MYCELPYKEMLSHVRFAFDGRNEENSDSAKANLNRANYVRNCLDFLRISYGRVRRICPVNAMYYRFNNFTEMQDFVVNIAKLVQQYRIDGLILSDYRVATLVHALLPELEIHTSCNGYQWNLRQMEIWREKCGRLQIEVPHQRRLPYGLCQFIYSQPFHFYEMLCRHPQLCAERNCGYLPGQLDIAPVAEALR